MKKQTNKKLLIRSNFILAMAIAMASWLPTAATAADEPMKPMKDGEYKMMQSCKAMNEKKEKMKVEMKAQNTKLTEQVAKMNLAPKDKKTDLMAAVLTRMVENRIAMDARKAKMKEEMMQHMQVGKESMEQCPMMKGMKDKDEKSADAHTEHQAEMTDTHKAHKAKKK
jgi:hypothetical protein